MEIFKAILDASKGLDGRVQGLAYGIVADIQDPMQLGRIRCLDASKGGKSPTDWLLRILPMTGFSPPLPALGTTVLIGYIDGDPHQGVYCGSLQNQVNPVVNSGQDLVITVGSVTVQIAPDGTVNILGASKLHIESPLVEFQGASSVTINGQQIATVGARDTRNDTLVTKGWS